ncbi:Bacterial regulatory protein, luxR family [compost metagenome]
MNLKLYRDLKNAFLEFAFYAHKSRGQRSVKKRIADFDIQATLQQFHGLGVYAYIVADNTTMKFIEAGGALEQLTGYSRKEVLGSGYIFVLKVFKLKELIKRVRGTKFYYEYFYKQPVSHRIYIKSNAITTLIRKDKKEFICLNQGIPLLLDDEGNALYYLNILTDISDIAGLNKKFDHYILDTANPENIVKIPLEGNYAIDDEKSLISQAEMKVLLLMAEGKSSKQIADDLFISIHTVNNHRKNMLAKLNCSTSAEIIKLAYVRGWL